MNIVIRPETPLDAKAIDAVVMEAFRGAEHSSHTEHFIVAELRAAGALAVSLVAEADGVVVGHVAASPVVIADGSTGWFGLGPLSVLPEHQRRGIGSGLMRAVLGELREQGAAGCVLLGEPEYYRRFGFEARCGLVLPGVPAQFFQALSLGASLPQGAVAYHAAFDARE